MEGFELSIVINRLIEEVFAVLTDLENDVKWRREWVETTNISGGSLGVGGTYRIRTKPERGVENHVGTSPAEIPEGL